MVYLYLIKLTQQKDSYLTLARKCFTIAIKTIQLSSHITQHDEFIKATMYYVFDRIYGEYRSVEKWLMSMGQSLSCKATCKRGDIRTRSAKSMGR